MTSYSFNVTETSPVGFVLGVISATDGDNDALTYTILNANMGKCLAVDVSRLQ
jgi:hypothetical protein